MKISRKGENLAALLLKKKGFGILCRNYKCRVGEIDLIARKNELLVFCEVKTRLNLKYGQPFEAVTQDKQKKIRLLAQVFLKSQKFSYKDIRFDVISILVKGEKSYLNHIENAF